MAVALNRRGSYIDFDHCRAGAAPRGVKLGGVDVIRRGAVDNPTGGSRPRRWRRHRFTQRVLVEEACHFVSA